MAKANADKVPYGFAEEVVKQSKDKGSVYSNCVLLYYRSTGRLSCGFDAKDIMAWIDKYMPEAFDAKGKKMI
jgi:hypothetical protein